MKASMFFGFIALMAASAASAQSTHQLAASTDWTPSAQRAGGDYVAPLNVVEAAPPAPATASHFRFQDANTPAPTYLKTAAQALLVATGHSEALKCVNAARTALPTRAPAPAAPTVDGCD